MTLFDPVQLGALNLPNRIVMAPMTRSRSAQPGDVPTPLMATYYAQRASAGLIVTEATQVSPQGKGYSFTPGIHSEAQIDGWREVTRSVHDAGGHVFLQLWHVGRMSHAMFQADGRPVAPSALAPNAKVWVVRAGVGQMVECPTPRALRLDEIPGIVEQFRQGAASAMSAGFDGVEIHGANGYLLDQFLRSTSNIRTDAYGGSIAKRSRLILEVARAVSEEAGANRTGIRLAPYITARDMACPEIIPAVLHVAAQLNTLGLAYIHLVEADWDDAPTVPEDFRHHLRAAFDGAIIVAGRYDLSRAHAILDAGLADLIAFGRPFVANPDLPARFAHQWPLADFDASTLFGGDAHGYTTYPPYPTPGLTGGVHA